MEWKPHPSSSVIEWEWRVSPGNSSESQNTNLSRHWKRQNYWAKESLFTWFTLWLGAFLYFVIETKDQGKDAALHKHNPNWRLQDFIMFASIKKQEW